MKHFLTPIAGLDLFFREEVGGPPTRATAPVSANVSPTISAVDCNWPPAPRCR